MSARVLGELGTPAYAVLDGARDGRVRKWVFDTRAPRWCLYRGKLTPEMQDAAPWLLRLVPGTPYVEEFFARFWGRAWGILLTSGAPAKTVRRQLRKLLLARTEDRRTLIFRYYDPRVLRVYLPTCTAAETATFFGEIDAFAAEEEGRSTAVIFHRGPTGLDSRRIDLAPPAGVPRASAATCS
jgi:hypothetical protein